MKKICGWILTIFGGFLCLSGTICEIVPLTTSGIELGLRVFMLIYYGLIVVIGFLIYIPFLVIDMVVASTLMSMGMMMLPPTTISMPFKILLFVLADGWNLIIVNLVKTFVT